MRNILVLIFALIIIIPSYAQDAIKRVIVETYYISDSIDATDTTGGKLEPGSKTYRIYIQMEPGFQLKSIYGDKNHALKIMSTARFFNNLDYGKSFGKDFTVSSLKHNTVALDTWLTLGQTTKTATKTYAGVLKTQDSDGSFIGGAYNDGGSSGISNGLLTNSDSQAGLPLTTVDGMEIMNDIPAGWFSSGFVDLVSGVDSTIFGSVKADSVFISYNAFLKNSGVKGVFPDSNQVLVAQLTTRGILSFELNVEIADKADIIWRYVAKGIDSANVSVCPLLKYPPEPPKCGCIDPNFLEFNKKYKCGNMDSCKTAIVFGCMDTKACNFDPRANYNMLCCYPGDCADRDISLVCPNLEAQPPLVDIYPNPVNNLLEIHFSNFDSDMISISIYNIDGNKIYNKKINSSFGNYKVDLSSYSNGLYLLHIQSNKGFNNTRYFIKQ